MAAVIRPAQGNWGRPAEDPKITALEEAFAKLSAHIINMDKRSEARQRFRLAQRYLADTSRPPSRPCSNCGGNHWDRNCPDQTNAPRRPGCYRCGKLEHQMHECREL